MKTSCAILSYNNGALLKEAIMSVVTQTHPVDEIIVADDGSIDGSRQLIETLAHEFPTIKPVFRDRNLGVTINRDLAMREAKGDFVTFLDGDDYFLSMKIEEEVRALRRLHGNVAFSNVRIVDRVRRRFRTRHIEDFALLEPSERVRWLLVRRRQSPAAMLIAKQLHMAIGGYDHRLKTYEDWDYILRLAAEPVSWVHSGAEGLVHHPGGGLSNQSQIYHLRDQVFVLGLNHRLARRHVGLAVLALVTTETVARSAKRIVTLGIGLARHRIAHLIRQQRRM